MPRLAISPKGVRNSEVRTTERFLQQSATAPGTFLHKLYLIGEP